MSSREKACRFEVKKGRLYQIGVHRVQDGLSIVSDIKGKKKSGILIYPEGEKEVKIPFLEEYLIGDLYCLFLPGFPYNNFSYLFYRDDEYVTDHYGRLLDSSKKFGNPGRRNAPVKCIFREEDYDWEEDTPLGIPYHESILYKIHMRGFTMHPSSKVKNRGTFAGFREKIPYLKDLGITAVESMPIYEFEDVIYNPSYIQADEALLPFLDTEKRTWEHKVNYWGYCEGHYMAPKRAYAASERPDTECKDMIKDLHKNGIEFIMQIYFPDKIRPGFILDVCRFWVMEYHVDGFKLMGGKLPVRLLATDPYLKKTKLIVESMNQENIYEGCDLNTSFKNLAVTPEAFRYDIRKYLKGDEDMLPAVMEHFRKNPREYGVVNEITSYQGFTLADLVSYDRKHNEANGEGNRDGNDYNYSWNCGVEGKTRKKQILSLRQQQCKNALLMLFLAQGTPCLLAGDEFGNSAGGNNNPYCQDNAVSWLNWKHNTSQSELQEFVRELIALRKAHPILHMEEQFKMMDYISCGCPDLSYHGEHAWYPGFENYNRHMGVMYCGKYARINKRKEDAFFYVAYNTHWVEHEFALPRLPAGLKWRVVMGSGKLPVLKPENDDTVKENDEKKQYHIITAPRTVVVLIGK